MTNEWRAIRRTGEFLGLSESELQEFISITDDVQREKLDTESHQYSQTEEYFEFLKSEVLPDERIIGQLRQSNVDESKLSSIEGGTFSIIGAFKTNYKFSYGLDELVDFIMMVKLVHDFIEVSANEWLTPLDRLHYLVYLTNNELAEELDYSARQSSVGLGMLERTGYRYTFRKQEKGAYSDRLKRDKDRLYAWNILEESVDSEYSAQEYQPLKLKLGSVGKTLYNRRHEQFDAFGVAESPLLREWHFKQEDVLQKYGNLSVEELRDHVKGLNDFVEKDTGTVLLTGRTRVFASGDTATTDPGGLVQNG